MGVEELSCVVHGSDLYCVGGNTRTAAYYAPLTSSGVGQWTPTTAYPNATGLNLASCVTISSEIYCIGGHNGPNISNSIHHASLSSSGIGQWVSDTNYPLGVWGESCVTSGSGIYCIGGESSAGVVAFLLPGYAFAEVK